MSPEDLFDTLEDLIEQCASNPHPDSDAFTVLITRLFLSEGFYRGDSRSHLNIESVTKWFDNLHQTYEGHTVPGSNLFPSRDDLALTKLSYYFVCLAWSSISVVYPHFASQTKEPFMRAIDDTKECLKQDLGNESVKPVTLIYSLYNRFFQEEVFLRDFSDFLATPEVSYTLTKTSKKVRVIEEKLFSLFPSEVAENILVITGNKRQNNIDEEPFENSHLSNEGLNPPEVSGWEWFSGNSKSILEKLKFGLKILRSFLAKKAYLKANTFNQQ